MKKILALFLSVVLILSMSVTAFATEVTSDYQVAQSTLSYTEPSTYTVIIPETMYVSTGAMLEFETKYINIQEDEQVVIRFANLDENGAIALSNESGDSVNVYFSCENGSDVCYRVNWDKTVALYAVATIGSTEGILPAGEYTGIAEFTVSVEHRVN